jgi:SAM-dependent methyltransferase
MLGRSLALPLNAQIVSSMDLRESWNRVAAQYLSCSLPATTVRYSLLVPTEAQLNLLGDVRGKRVLDLGCGGGHNCVALSKAGAHCTGVDLSDVQIGYAHQFAEQEAAAATFVRADMADFLADRSTGEFDLVLSTGALPYVEALEDILWGVHRVLQSNGLFVLSVDHPMRTVTRVQDGQVVFCSSYFARGRESWNWESGQAGEPVLFHSFHRTVSDYTNGLIEAGFHIERMLEPEPVAEESDMSPEEMNHLAMVPATLIYVASPRVG